MSKKLKVMAGQVVKESNYSVSAKKQLLNFIINEANDSQLKALILDGNIEKLDEDAIDIVNRRFDLNSNLTEEYNLFIKMAKEELCNNIGENISDYNAYDDSINFIMNEASNYQILSMFLEGNLPEETSNTEKESSLNETVNCIIRGDIDSLNEEIGTFGKAAIATVAAGPLGLITYGAYKVFQRYMTKAGSACRKAIDRRACRKQYKINALKMQINALRSGMSKCAQAKKPEKCKASIEKKIAQLSAGLAGTAASSKQRAEG